MDYIIAVLYFSVILLLIGLSWTDIRSRIISNNIILFLFFIILPLAWLTHGQIFIFSAFMALCAGFILFTLGVIGAGDAKLVSVLMLTISAEQIIPFLFFTSFAGLLLIIIGWLFFRESIKRNGLPYGVAISIGFLTNLAFFYA
ncbi:prepilin peptidase [Glaesserella sp.]|uniref:A24 family peptidase n=1 Tax=Glaesserella sp. TaxID=2094731 RepID=UPI0035A0C1A8